MKRFYFALTNDCTHSCAYCSCFSRPGKKTYMDFDVYTQYVDSTDENIEVQFEGGEPLIHPRFYDMVDYAINTNRCDKVIITTNSSEIPYTKEKKWMKFIINNPNTQFILKPSINYDLWTHQDNLFPKMSNILEISKNISNLTVLFNVRLDKTENDESIKKILGALKLTEHSNIFFYQRYGFAKDVEKFDLPFIIPNPVDFYLISPDGMNFGTDLIARSEHMKDLK
jgi:molybdenum cofactor biosynthesis enzyme MoaA